MNDNEIAKRLEPITEVRTLSEGVRNQIVEIGPDRVTVRSERTGTLRTISFDQIRRGGPPNGRIIRALRQVLGMD